MLKSYGRYIATTLFESRGIEAEVKSGFASIKNKTTLKALKVLAGNERIPAGAIVWVRSDMFKAEWAVKAFEANGMMFILVPEDYVVLVESE